MWLLMNVYEGLCAKNVQSQEVICKFYMFDKGLRSLIQSTFY